MGFPIYGTVPTMMVHHQIPGSYTPNRYVLRFFRKFSKIVKTLLDSKIIPNSYGFLKFLL